VKYSRYGSAKVLLNRRDAVCHPMAGELSQGFFQRDRQAQFSNQVYQHLIPQSFAIDEGAVTVKHDRFKAHG
jgi:hypothetical protein